MQVHATMLTELSFKQKFYTMKEGITQDHKCWCVSEKIIGLCKSKFRIKDTKSILKPF